MDAKEGQGAALDPQRAGGPLIPFIIQKNKVQGSGLSREGVQRTWGD
jgi:hypothetical protein